MLQKTRIPTTINPIYDSTPTIDFKVELGAENVPSAPEVTGHIYSEVTKKNDWIPNPTYGQAGLLLEQSLPVPNGQQSTEGAAAPENKIYDSPKRQPLEIPELNRCPAYDEPPMLPRGR